MTKLLVVTAITATFMLFVTPSANAEVEYPWCAYYGRFGTQATNCGFTTYQQCLATISGIGGYCERNPRYPVRKKRH